MSCLVRSTADATSDATSPRLAAAVPFARRTESGDALAAWQTLAGRPVRDVSIVRVDPDSARPVYRLRGIRPGGADVIAKRLPPGGIERWMYERVVPTYRIAAATYLGTVAHGGAEWLFLEDVGGRPYDWSVAGHRRAGGRWLGTLYAAAAAATPAGGPPLPIRDIDYWHALAFDARAFVAALPPRLALRGPGRRVVSRALGACDEVLGAWRIVESVGTRVPDSLVHGDLVAKNLRLRVVANRLEAVPFDWESAGFGMVAIDLAYVDAAAFLSVAGAELSGLREPDVRPLSNVGRLLRTLQLVLWLDGLDPQELAASLDTRLAHYDRWLRADLRALVEADR